MTIDKRVSGRRGRKDAGDRGGAGTAPEGGAGTGPEGGAGTGPEGGAGTGPEGGAGGGHADPAATGTPGSVPQIEFRLDHASGVPTYLQLVQQVEHALRLGYLRRGDQLPRVRDVVGSLAINPNTVLKAYRELEHKGLAAGRPGQGTFVEGSLGQVALPELTMLRRSLLAWLATADRAGLDEDGIVALFTSALRDFHERHGAHGHGSHIGGTGDIGGDRSEGIA